MKSSNIQMTTKEAAVKYGALICDLAKDDRVVRVLENGNRTRIFIRANVEWYGRPAHKVVVKGSVEDIKKEFSDILSGWVNLGISVPRAFYAWQRGISWDKHVVEVPAGTAKEVLKVTGTYFGSGSYVASWRSNAESIVEGKDRDTGFAVEEPSTITLQPGEYLIQYESSSPGSDIRRIYLCK